MEGLQCWERVCNGKQHFRFPSDLQALPNNHGLSPVDQTLGSILAPQWWVPCGIGNPVSSMACDILELHLYQAPYSHLVSDSIWTQLAEEPGYRSPQLSAS